MEKTIVRRDKEKTKQRILNAVGKILRKEGFHAIKINKVAETARLTKPLIYNYFKGLNGLIKAYLNQVDFWNQEEEKLFENNTDLETTISKEAMLSIKKDNFEYLEKSPEMQKIILWGISEKNKSIQSMMEQREEFGERIFKVTDKDFEGSDVDFRAVNAIFVAAIYYMTLHTKTTGVTMCGIDVATNDGKQRIFDTFSKILDWCYSEKKNPL